MQKVLVPYNYTPKGMQLLRDSQKYFYRAKVEMVACYLPQWFCIEQKNASNLEAQFTDYNILRDHFLEMIRLPEFSEGNFSFGGVISDIEGLEHVIQTKNIEAIAKGFSGRENMLTAFFSKSVENSISEKFNVLFVKTNVGISDLNETLFISNCSNPFSDFHSKDAALSEKAAYFTFVHNPGLGYERTDAQRIFARAKQNLNLGSLDNNIIHSLTIEQTILQQLNGSKWSNVFLELEPESLSNYNLAINNIKKTATKLRINLTVVLPTKLEYRYELPNTAAL